MQSTNPASFQTPGAGRLDGRGPNAETGLPANTGCRGPAAVRQVLAVKVILLSANTDGAASNLFSRSVPASTGEKRMARRRTANAVLVSWLSRWVGPTLQPARSETTRHVRLPGRHGAAAASERVEGPRNLTASEHRPLGTDLRTRTQRRPGFFRKREMPRARKPRQPLIRVAPADKSASDLCRSETRGLGRGAESFLGLIRGVGVPAPAEPAATSENNGRDREERLPPQFERRPREAFAATSRRPAGPPAPTVGRLPIPILLP